MPIDITNESTVILSDVEIPIALISILARTDYNRVVVESNDASREEIEVRRNGTGFDFTRSPRSRKGTDAQPVESEFRAELVSPDSIPQQPQQRRWVDRGSPEHDNLTRTGWEEKGKTRPRPVVNLVNDPSITEDRGRDKVKSEGMGQS